MAKSNKGTIVQNPEDKQPPSEKELGTTAKNEFAPNVVGGKQVDPAPTPEPSMQNDAGATAPAEQDSAGSLEEYVKPREEDFLEYVHGDLTKIAGEFGYDLSIKKRNVVSGPVMMYHRETREGKVFGAREEAGPDYMSGDELQEVRADERGE